MRVAYLINQYPQPSQSFIRREIAALISLGVEVQRFTIRRWPGTLVDPHDQAERQQTTALLEHKPAILAAVAAMLLRPARLAAALAAAWGMGRRSGRGLAIHLVYLAEASLLQRWLAQRKIEHLHAHFGTNSAAVAMLCRLLGGPGYSFTVHGPEEFDAPLQLSLAEKVHAARFAVVIGFFGCSQLRRWSALDDWPKIHLVRCGLDAAFLADPPAAPPLPGRLVCVARLDGQKGLITLIDAAAKLRDGGAAFELRLIGDGPLRAAIEARIAGAHLADRVKLLGWKSAAEVRMEIEQARALVLPSFAEGLPVVIMEALARHRPVISTTVAAIPELVRSGESGWLVAPASVDDLAAAMRKAIDADDATLAAMGGRGALLVAANHDAGIEARKLMRLIESAIAGSER